MDSPFERVVLKVGGSVITRRGSGKPLPRKEKMRETAGEISSYDGSLVLVHGSGSYGHPQAEGTELWTGVDTDDDRMDLARLQRLQNELNTVYCSFLQDNGVPAFPVQPSASGFMEEGSLENLEETVVQKLLELGMVPVLYGVPAVDVEEEAAVLSGDEISAYLSWRLDMDMVLHATDVEGVYDGEPGEGRIIDELDSFDPSMFASSGRPDASGGMKGKIRKLFEYGQEGMVFSGEENGLIREVLKGEERGTHVVPEG
ncbi:MAG: isopentenyl phosphate kinase [Candidatus Nanohaloarchaea archaeon]